MLNFNILYYLCHDDCYVGILISYNCLSVWIVVYEIPMKYVDPITHTHTHTPLLTNTHIHTHTHTYTHTHTHTHTHTQLRSKVLHIFLLFSLYFSSLNLKYLKLTKMDITRFAIKLFT